MPMCHMDKCKAKQNESFKGETVNTARFIYDFTVLLETENELICPYTNTLNGHIM